MAVLFLATGLFAARCRYGRKRHWLCHLSGQGFQKAIKPGHRPYERPQLRGEFHPATIKTHPAWHPRTGEVFFRCAQTGATPIATHSIEFPIPSGATQVKSANGADAKPESQANSC